MITTHSPQPWVTLAVAHMRWVLRTTWRNGEQILLLIGIPVAAFLALTQTDLLSNAAPPEVITTAMIVLAAGFTSPAISLAFERRYGSFALLGTTPIPRSAIVAGTLAAIALGALIAVAILHVVARVVGESTDLPRLIAVTVLGLIAVVPWAFVLGGTLRSESVLVVANATFVVAVLFGGVLIPAAQLPYGQALKWLPPGAVMDFALLPQIRGVVVLVAWGLLGLVVSVRLFRWR
jgi:ABC-2 type transport system permease protein